MPRRYNKEEYKYIVSIRGTTGYAYLKTGDESGDLCLICGNPMIILKTKTWSVYCRECDREIEFISHAVNESAYR